MVDCYMSHKDQWPNKIRLKKNILLLQGPIGKFFNYFRTFCYKKTNVEQVYKINFHLGELILYRDKNTYFYRGGIEEWGAYFKEILKTHQIEQIFLLSQHRIYHQIAIEIAKQLDIEVYVFEQGYVRPHFITIERNGVNVNTNLSKDPKFYSTLNPPKERSEIKPYDSIILNKHVKNMAMLPYHWLMFVFHAHIYGYGIVVTNYLINRKHVAQFDDRGKWIPYHIFNFLKLFFNLSTDKLNFFVKNTHDNWVKKNKKQYYLYPLQVANDTQITYGANITVEESLKSVVKSFKHHASPETFLVIKHHPIDRGHNNYKKLINSLSKRYGVEHRVKYIYRCDLDITIKNAIGVIVINSTVGLTALQHKVPVICLSNTAIYNIPFLTYQKGLDSFWTESKDFIVNEELFNNFYLYMKKTTQFQGEFYAPYFTQWEQMFC